MSLDNIDALISDGTGNRNVYKDECAFSFASPEDEQGIFICLRTFLGVGPDVLEKYVKITGNSIFLQYRITRTYKRKDPNAVEPAQPKKLAIGVAGGFELPHDKYVVSEKWCLRRFPGDAVLEIPCPPENTAANDKSHLNGIGLSEKVMSCINVVQRCESAILVAERAGAAQAWEAENLCPISKFAESLAQLDNGVTIPPSGHKCYQCDLTTNLWLNLSDGTISCGRRFWDGSGGNNHAIEHFERTGYPLAVKLGTITPKGAEVFSYAEDDMVTDPLLAQHLAHFGIDMQTQRKTDRTVLELEVEANERLGEWLTLQEADKTLCPLYGPGLTGLVNLGSSCYINSAVQVLFSTAAFRRRYAQVLPDLTEAAMRELAQTSNPLCVVDSLGLQLAKLGQGLCSGTYSFPPAPSNEQEEGHVVPKQPGIRPRMFRHVIGKTNAEFATKQQQDVQEFISHLFSLVERDVASTIQEKDSPLAALTFAVEDRLECGSTGRVAYKERLETMLCLSTPLEAASNREEVAAFEKRKQQAADDKIPFKEEPVYLKVSLESCLANWAAQETIADFLSPATDPPMQRTTALHSSRLSTFPDILCVQMLKFQLGENWVPRKLNVAIQLDSTSVCGRPSPDWRLNLSGLRAFGGLQPGEVAMPVDSEDALQQQQRQQSRQQEQLQPDEVVVEQLMTMGFSCNACRRACLATFNGGVEAASNWLMEHLDDANLNDDPASPATTTTGIASAANTKSSNTNVDEAALATLLEMGIPLYLATPALKACNNDLEAALNLAFSDPDQLLSAAAQEAPPSTSPQPAQQQAQQSNATAAVTRATVSNGDPSNYELIAFISHMGESTACGHYVCHIKRSALGEGIAGVVPACDPSPRLEGAAAENEWVIFNDEKSSKSASSMSDKSDDLYLPYAVIMRIIREALPAERQGSSGNLVSREARSAISKAASSFILCVTSMASTHCEAGRRKTLAASDVIGALRDMQFGHFESPLLEYLEAYRESMAAKKNLKRAAGATSSASKSAAADTANTAAVDTPRKSQDDGDAV